MVTLQQLLDAPEIARATAVVHVADPDRSVHGVALVESLDELTGLPPDTVALLTTSATEQLTGYSTDVALRRAAQGRIAALVLRSPSELRLDVVTQRIADRSGVGLLQVDRQQGGDLAALLLSIQAEIDAGTRRALDRVRGMAEILDATDYQDDIDAGSTLARLQDRWGAQLALVEQEPDDDRSIISHPLEVEGHVEGHVVSDGPTGAPRELVRLVGRWIASELGARIATQRRTSAVPLQSAKELLTEVLLTDSRLLGPLASRARDLGLPIDGVHVVTRIELDGLTATSRQEALSNFELRERMASAAIEEVRATGGSWYGAGTGNVIVLVRMMQHDLGPDSVSLLAPAVEQAIDVLTSRFRDADVYCGIGHPHRGVDGLRQSNDEAVAAITSARNGKRRGEPVRFDAVGLRRMLLQWYAADEARNAVAELLAPLDDLGPDRGDEAIRTLQAYLDNMGSTSAAAEELHVHRNTVRYRLERIFDLLDADPESPDDRLALLLACRARTT